jgi:tRNA 2-thiouridine synthesizing protein E
MSLMDEITGSGGAERDPAFPHAPAGWTRAQALETARQEGLAPGDAHWEAVRALQEFFARHEPTAINLRQLHDALDEKFHRQGGIRRLYLLFPGGPVAQGCRIAGLKAPAGAADKGFGSVA